MPTPVAYAWGAVQTPGGPLRYFHTPGKPEAWYAVVDLMGALGQPKASASMTVKKLPPERLLKFLVDNIPHLAVDQTAMIELVMRSQAPRAEDMRGWVRWWLDERLKP